MALPFIIPDEHNNNANLVNTFFKLFRLIFTLLRLYKFLRELVECNICFEIPTAQTEINQCINGHILCNSCYTEYNNLRSRDIISETSDIRHQPCCPVCRATHFGIRSIIAEKLVAKLTESTDSQESSTS